MAKLHAEETIRPSYVREVCRLLRASNINLVKRDLEFEDNQEQINLERRELRQQQQQLLEAGQNAAIANKAGVAGLPSGAEGNNLFEMERDAEAVRASQA